MKRQRRKLCIKCKNTSKYKLNYRQNRIPKNDQKTRDGSTYGKNEKATI